MNRFSTTHTHFFERKRYYSVQLKSLQKYQALLKLYKNNFLTQLSRNTSQKVTLIKNNLFKFVRHSIFLYKFYTFWFLKLVKKSQQLQRTLFTEKIYTYRKKCYKDFYRNSFLRHFKQYLCKEYNCHKYKYQKMKIYLNFFKICKSTLKNV